MCVLLGDLIPRLRSIRRTLIIRRKEVAKKRSRYFAIFLVGVFVLGIFTSSSLGEVFWPEKWTEEQKEVWSRVESFWEQVKEGNKAGIEEGIHGEAIGWVTNKENGKWLSVSWMAASCEKESKCLNW